MVYIARNTEFRRADQNKSVILMKKSAIPTPHILVKAFTTSEWDSCDFAIIHITEEWKTEMANRIKLLEPLIDTRGFFNLSFWDAPEGYYLYSPELEASSLLASGEDWCYVITDDMNWKHLRYLKTDLMQSN